MGAQEQLSSQFFTTWKSMAYISYLFYRIWIWLFRITPFWVLYRVSDALCFFLYSVVRYRREETYSALSQCFPELGKNEIREIEKASYRNLSDILLESVKGMTMSESTIRKRFRYDNPYLVDPLYDANKSFILASGHVCNWEWGVISLSLNFRHDIVGIYKPLQNPYIEEHTSKCRSRTGMILAGMKETRQILEKQKGRPTAFILMADQNPSNPQKSVWLDFFGRDTGFHHGPGSIAKAYDFPLYYLSIKRIKRGYYEAVVDELIDDPTHYTVEEIVGVYVQKLMQQIREQKPDWLWSHRRWKHKRPLRDT